MKTICSMVLLILLCSSKPISQVPAHIAIATHRYYYPNLSPTPVELNIQSKLAQVMLIEGKILTAGNLMKTILNSLVASEPEPCPNPKKLENICMNIDGRSMDPKPKSHYVYLYQRKILDAACVDVEKDSEEKISQKVQQMWTASTDNLNCRSIDFDANGGNVLKYAVSTTFDEFLDDAIYWKVNLNQVDKVDDRTVLDYVQHQIEKNKGKMIEVRLKHYYKILREAGAKHKSKL